MNFKKGDKIVVVKNKCQGIWPRRDKECPVGSIGIVRFVGKEMPSGREYVRTDIGSNWDFYADEVELVQGCLMERIKPPKEKRSLKSVIMSFL